MLHLRCRKLHFLLLISAAFPVMTWFVTGAEFPLFFSAAQLVAVFLFSCTAVLMVLAVHILASIQAAPSCVDPLSGRLDVHRLWQRRTPWQDCVLVVLLMSLLHFSLAGMPMIAEVYRQSAVEWYDSMHWSFERPLLVWLSGSTLVSGTTKWWEFVYHLMWIYVMTVLVLHVTGKRDEAAGDMVLETTLIFYAAHILALYYPTAGPALYRPDEFSYLQGSLTAGLQSLLADYQSSRIVQNGVMYGLVAMPSVHVSLAWLAGHHLLCWRLALWPVALLMLLAIWIATLVLGWHYAVDGVAGIVIACVAILVRKLLRRAWHHRSDV